MSRAKQLHGGSVIRTATTVQAHQRRLLSLPLELEAAAETLGTQALPDTPLTVVSFDAPLKEGEEALKEGRGKKHREVLTDLPAREEEIVRL